VTTRDRYHRLSISAKQARHREAMREPAIPCPHCEVQTTASDLLRHVETSCPGRREPHPLSKWVKWGEAREMGVPDASLRRWVRQGRVRTRIRARNDNPPGPGRPARRVYLVRDMVKLMALRRRITAKDGGKGDR
jgi:hypothetical protein